MRRLARKGRGACLGSQCGEIGLGFARNGKPRARFRATCFLTFCPMVNCHVSIFRSPCRPDSAAAASATATAVQSSDRIRGRRSRLSSSTILWGLRAAIASLQGPCMSESATWTSKSYRIREILIPYMQAYRSI